MAPSPPWLSVCRHRIRGFGAPYLLILQHHIVDSRTRIVAPVVPAESDRATLLAPRLEIRSVFHRAVMLDMTSAALGLLGEIIEEARLEQDNAVSAALDAIFRGYPVGLPLR